MSDRGPDFDELVGTDLEAGERKRLTVFTGPVYRPDDPPLGGVPIPKEYW